MFARYIGIDYSGAATPTSSLPGLRVYRADVASAPVEVGPPPSPRKYWTRRGVAEWLADRLSEEQSTLVGIDHGFSFPLRYFEAHRLPFDWPAFLDDFQRHWPTDEDVYVDFVRDGSVGNGAARTGNARWRRLTELRAGSAKSVFHFDVQGSVAKSTHSGLPWLRYLRQRLAGRVHFWPFDGWTVPPGRSAIAEVYPSLWRREFVRGARTADQHDAYSVAAWMRRADADGSLAAFFEPVLTPAEHETARVEGWILGLPGGEASPFRTRPSSDWVASNRLAFAIRDAFPVSPGHTLVVPRRVVSSWFDTTAVERTAILELLDDVKRALDAEFHPDGYNVGFNAGEAAGQTVLHLHVHVIPRYQGDVEDPRGGIRHVIPGKGNYLTGSR